MILINQTKYFLDTNALLNHVNELDVFEKFYISSITLEELENIKTSSKKDEKIKYDARQVVRYLKRNQDKFVIIPVTKKQITIIEKKELKETNDNLIIASAYSESLMCGDLIFVTEDLLCEIFARDIFGLEVKNNFFKSKSKEDYKGFKEITLDSMDDKDNEKLANIYEEPYNNIFNLYTNQYLIIRDKQIPVYDENLEFVEDYKVIDVLKWDGDNYVKVNNIPFSSMSLGRVKPKDTYQTLVCDSLRSNQMSMIKGKAGSGKTLLGLSYAMSMIESGKYSKLVVFGNPVNTKNSAKLGFYPGSRTEKILDSSIGLMLSCKFGGKSELQELIDKNRIVLLPFSDIRGYDLSGMNAIVYILEAQNLDIELLKIAIQRTSEDCKLILDGDYNAQTDMNIYEGLNNGMRRASEVFKGQDFYGEVELQNIYRSRMAAIADFM